MKNFFCTDLYLKKRYGLVSITWKRFASTESSSSLKIHYDYIRTILKKFMFQVHPDYFYNFKPLQDINNQNLRLLQGLFHEGNDPSSRTVHMKIDTRSLTFYLKPNDLWQDPKKVKVSTNRLVDSMIEILETIGIEIPEKPQDFDHLQSTLLHRNHSFSSSTSWANQSRRVNEESESILDSETLKIIQFLDSLADRRELISLREDRIRILSQTEKELMALTELARIEYWNSWSAHNNRLLLHNILNYVQEHQQDLQLPWKGLTLILARDDAASFDVDYIERNIRIDCSNISGHWIKSFYQITTKRLKTMEEVRQKIDHVQEDIERIFMFWIKKELEKEKNCPKIIIEISKGFTCSRRSYAEWLGRIRNEVSVLKFDSSFQLSSQKQTEPGIREVESSIGSSSGIHGKRVTAPDLDLLPVRIKCVVEDNHGSKLLLNGQFRFDCRSTASQVQQLFQSFIRQAIYQTEQQHFLETEMKEIEKKLIELLEISSIGRGRGIDDEKYLFALRNLNEYLLKKNHVRYYTMKTNDQEKQRISRGILKHLAGLRIIIGHYHGIRDDGACILPWNFKIQEIV